MYLQVFLHQLGERDRPTGTNPLERASKRPLRIVPGREAADLRTLRTAAVYSVAVGPHRFPVRPPRPQLEHVTVLRHHGTSFESTTKRGIDAHGAPR